MNISPTPLTQREADGLIAELKKTILQTITLPDSIERKTRFTVQATRGDNQYFIQIHRGNKNPRRLQFAAIFKKENVALLRLCVNGGTHKNPDGTRISGTHWHRYDDVHGDKVAYEATGFIGDLIDETCKFLTAFNVTDQPSLAGGLL